MYQSFNKGIYMKKLFILFSMLFLLNNLSFSTESRLLGMGGISYLNFIVVPDIWCDTFFVNPAYASDNSGDFDKFYLNNYLSIYINPSENKKTVSSDSNYDNKYFNLIANDNSGMLIQIKRMVLGFQFGFNTSYYKADRENYYKPDKTSDITENQVYNLNGSLLFSFFINEKFNFGFNAGVNAKIYDVNTENYEQKNTTTGVISSSTKTNSKVPININGTINIGFINKFDNLTLSYSFPVFVVYNQTYNGDFYNKTIDDWEKRVDFIYGGIRSNLVFDIQITKIFSLRIPIYIGFTIKNITRQYNANRSIFTNLKGNEQYYVNQFGIPVSGALSINNKINEKVLLDYGFDFRTTSLIGNGFSNEYNKNSNIEAFNINLDIGTFVGGEFNISQWFTLRTGFESYLFNFSYISYKNIDRLAISSLGNFPQYTVSSYSKSKTEIFNINDNTFSFLSNMSVYCGVSFNPIKWFSLELTSSLYSYMYNRATNESNVDDQSFSFVINFSLGTVFKL
jgi:hypothetical protein